MTFVLDTHALLWFALNDPKLSAAVLPLIDNTANRILVSPVSYWEIAIKVSLGKLQVHRPLQDFFDLCLLTYGFETLPVQPEHTVRLAALPFHHKDPFDRLLIAQALVEQIPIISGDAVLDQYGVQRVW